MHSTKLPLWKWLLAMYYIAHLSKGVSSVFLGKWVGISQKSAWKIGHAVRKMMDPGTELVPALQGIVELDEKYIGGKPRYEHGLKHKRGRGNRSKTESPSPALKSHFGTWSFSWSNWASPHCQRPSLCSFSPRLSRRRLWDSFWRSQAD